jgi:anti-sigma regulatory factor (Ser/Thr protein kinase)
VSADGECRFLWEGRSPPLGLASTETRPVASGLLTRGDTLLLYTDGLVEERGRSLDRGFDRLAAAAAAWPLQSLSDVVDGALEAMVDATAQEDDVCLIAVRALPVAATFRRTLPAQLVELGSLRAALREWFDHQGVKQEEANEVLVAVGEAAANAIEHGYGPDGHGVVTVDASMADAGELLVVVRDHGAWIDRPSARDRGRGNQLMRALMDEVEVGTGTDGTEVRMRRQLCLQAASTLKP